MSHCFDSIFITIIKLMFNIQNYFIYYENFTDVDYARLIKIITLNKYIIGNIGRLVCTFLYNFKPITV